MVRRSSGRRALSGLTLIETVVGAALLSIVAGVAFQLLEASRDLAESSCNQHLADVRVDRGLAMIERDFRSGSLSSAQHMDGTPFGDGESGAGFAIRPVVGWEGGAVLGELVEYRLEIQAGESDGEVVRTVGAIETTLATEVTSFVVTRTGTEFTMTMAARSGPDDDRGRSATGTLRVLARNR